jgi:hypothetical protein
MNAAYDTCVKHLDGLDCPIHGPFLPGRKKAPLEHPNFQDVVVDPTVPEVRQGREVRARLPARGQSRVR